MIFQFPVNQKLYSPGPGHVRYHFVGNLNVSYKRNGPDLEIEWITWGTDDVKTQIQDLLQAIAPDLYEQIVEAMHGNYESLTWKNGDEEPWDTVANDFEE